LTFAAVNARRKRILDFFLTKNICGGLCDFTGGLKPPEKRGGK
jgi:hypothetical protein